MRGRKKDMLGFRQWGPFGDPNLPGKFFRNELVGKLALNLFFCFCCAVMRNLASYNMYRLNSGLLLWLQMMCFSVKISSFEKLPMPKRILNSMIWEKDT